mmetsp:Transcript_35795/g.73196  ORF Transcript_35795/g.73196 Transcript_35795/m.73196 type:complete len:216 (-) Transcript_35795:162-809(-)
MMRPEVTTGHTACESPFQLSSGANEIFLKLQADGLKNCKKSSQTNMDVLGNHKRVFPKNMGVFVDVSLAREKDSSLADRAKLAEEVQRNVLSELQEIFRGDEPHEGSQLDGEVVLCVRIVLVSDGTSSGHRWMAEHGVGKAKLTLVYCLQSARTGEIAMANQLYACEDCEAGSKDICFREYSAAVVRTLARNLAGDIAEEVTNEIIHWKISKRGQ